METNYYLRRAIHLPKLKELKELVNPEDIYNGSLQKALEEVKSIHIGKSSTNGQFCFDHNNWKYYDKTKKGIRTFLIDELLDGGKIVDEHGNFISLIRLWEIVEKSIDVSSTLELQYPDMITDEGLRFAYSTNFC